MAKSIQLKNASNEKIYPHSYYPIGSIYLSVTDINPSKWFGGTWEQIAQGRTLIGVDTNDSDFNTVKKIGGEKKHKLTINEMPSHSHTKNSVGWTGSGGFWVGSGTYTTLDFDKDTGLTGYTGGNQAHNNLQPYFTCYIWCRIA